MGLLGFLDFVLKCIQLLAWPSFALGYPLCASIRAIETNSNFHMRKLVAYWILFSLISLFEYIFSKLLEWVPLWAYVKILAICWLVIPAFNGASIAYNNIVRPCLSMQLPQIIVDLLNKKQDLSLTRESFLVVAERYVKENGTEALEKLIASKPKINEPLVAQKDIKAVEILDKSAAAAENKPKINEPPVAQKDIKAVEILDKSAAAAENKPKINEPPVAQKDIKDVEILDKSAAAAENKPKINEPPVAQKDIKALEILDKNAAAAENKPKINEPPVAQKDIKAVEILDKSAAAAENKITTVDADIKVNNTALPEKLTENVSVVPPAFKNVQKEWTCALCQVTTQSEATLNSHLQGMKHRTKCEELNAGKQTATKKGVSIGGPNRERSCAISQVTTRSETTLTSLYKESITGMQTAKKNNSSSTTIKSDQPNQDQRKVSSGSGPNIRGVNKNLSATAEVKIEANVSNGFHSCSICNLTCSSASHMSSHLRGKRHLSQIEDSVHTSVVHYWCNICDVKCKSETAMASHLYGKKHGSNLYDSD